MPLESDWLHQSTELTLILVYSSTCCCWVLPTAIIPQAHNSTTCPFSCQHSFPLKYAVNQTNTFKEDESYTAIACVAFSKSQSFAEVMRIWGILCYKHTDVYSTCMACLWTKSVLRRLQHIDRNTNRWCLVLSWWIMYQTQRLEVLFLNRCLNSTPF